MGRVILPEGVAPTNETGSMSESAGFSVPNTATPEFACANDQPVLSAAAQPEPIQTSRGRFYRFEEDDDEDDEDKKRKASVRSLHGAHPPRAVIFLVAIVLVLAAIGAFVIAREQADPLPYCSEQPEWNQYNCRAG